MGMNIDRVKQLLYDSMTDKQKQFYDRYLLNGCNGSRTASELGISPQAASGYANGLATRILLDIIADKEAGGKKFVPTIEWTLGEYTKMYEGILDRIRVYQKKVDETGELKYLEAIDKLEVKQRSILNDIKDYQKKFGDKVDEDDLKIKLTSLPDLIKEFNIGKEEVEKVLVGDIWKAA